MPLIVMCGIPGSGKSSRSYEIAEYLKSKYKQKVIIVNEESLKVDKNQSYSTSQQQKMMRGKIKFEVQKNLNEGVIVIADSLNYIKGYRYQMFCIARQQKTTYCVVYCNTNVETAREFNAKNNVQFNKELFQDLVKRMEAPQLKNRWDVPLFQRREEQPTPVQQIAQVLLFQAKKSKDPVSTKQDQKLSQDYLYEMDKICQQICDQVVMAKFVLKNNWNALQLKKIKKDFVNMIKQKPVSLKSVKESFKNFLIEADKRK